MQQTEQDLIYVIEYVLIARFLNIHPLDTVKSTVILKVLTTLSLFLVVLKYVSMTLLHDLEINSLYHKIDFTTKLSSFFGAVYFLWLINECGLLLDDINCYLTEEEQKLFTQDIRNVLFYTKQ